LEDSNQFIQGLALTTLANIGSPDICRGLSPEVEKLLFSSAYIRKKAALCACRIFSKAPELVDNYIDKVEGLLKEQKNHSVLITVVSMITEMTKQEENISKLVSIVPLLLRILKGLLSSSFQVENEISGIADPFLQVKLLKLLGILGKGNQKASELMHDMLVQVATHTESNKNAGYSILYQVVETILMIECETVHLNLATTILGKFLTNKDYNIRYVALNTLKKIDSTSLKKYLKTILDCLNVGHLLN
jgi:AP-1 complex subunit gamma-1